MTEEKPKMKTLKEHNEEIRLKWENAGVICGRKLASEQEPCKKEMKVRHIYEDESKEVMCLKCERSAIMLTK